MKRIHIEHALRGPWWYGEDCKREDPSPAGVLHGDEWNESTGEIRRGGSGQIVGIVDFVAKTRYGFSSRLVPQYLFHPADPRFPPMIVGSKAATTENQWGVITTKDLVWSTVKSRWPSVSLQRLLGPVGNIDVELEALRLRYMRPVPRKVSENNELLNTGYREYTLSEWDEVFNIDPMDCRDIDDVLAWRKTADGYEFGIGIANVATLVPQGSALDETARLRAQSLYRNGEAIEPMLPTSISEGAGSLLADGIPRGVVMAIWRLEGGSLTGPIWRASTIVNKRTFTYESVLEDPTISNTLTTLLKQVTGADVGYDPHKWVEIAMVTYNCAAAEQLTQAGVGILRRHQGMLATTGLQYQDLAEKTECKELAFLGYAAGQYICIEPPRLVGELFVTQETQHVGLRVQRYCHATSPLRRYADLVNQRILLGILEATCVKGFVDNAVAKWLNERGKEARVYDREAWCLTQLSTTEIRSAEGWVVGWSKYANPSAETRIRIYVPAWKRVVKVPLTLHIKEEQEKEREKEKEKNDRIYVGDRGNTWRRWVLLGDSVTVSAFWDTRNTPEHRFVFRCTIENH